MAEPKTTAELTDELKNRQYNLFNSLYENKIKEQKGMGVVLTPELKAQYKAEAKKTAELLYGAPMTTEFGTFQEKTRKPAVVASPINIAPMEEITSPLGKMLEVAKAQSYAQKEKPAVVIDTREVLSSLKDNQDIPDAEKPAVARAYTKAVNDYQRENPNVPIWEIQKYVQEEIQNISKGVPKKKVQPTDDTTLFGAQTTNAVEVPDYSIVQATYLNEFFKTKQEDYVKQNQQRIMDFKPKSKRIVLQSGNTMLVPTDVYEYILRNANNLNEPMYSDKIDEQIRNAKSASGSFIPKSMMPDDAKAYAKLEYLKNNTTAGSWYLDPEKKKKVYADPDAFKEDYILLEGQVFGEGILKRKNPLYETETLAGQLVRDFSIPFNVPSAIAGAVVPPTLDYVFGDQITPALEAKRMEEAPKYEGSAFWTNLATNKGFVGELSDFGEVVGASPSEQLMLLGLGAIADFRTGIGIFTSPVKGAKAANNIMKAQKAVDGGADVMKAAQFGAAETWRALNEAEPLVAAASKKVGLKPLPAGSVVNNLTEETAAGLRYIDKVKRAEQTTDVEKASNAAKQAEKVGVAKVEASMKNTPQAKKIVETYEDTINYAIADAAKLNPSLTEFPNANAKVVQEARRAVGDDPKDLEMFISNVYGRSLLFEKAPQSIDLKNIVSLTRNTFVHKDDANKLYQQANNNTIGKILKEIDGQGYKSEKGVRQSIVKQQVGGEPIIGAGGRSPEIMFNATEEQILSLQKALEDAGFGKLADEVGEGRLTLSLQRDIVDANLDAVAKAEMKRIGVEDVERLRSEKGELLPEAREALQPEATRFTLPFETPITAAIGKSEVAGGNLGRMARGLNWLKKELRLNNVSNVIPTTADIRTQRAVKETQNKLSALDTKLRRTMNGLSRKDNAAYVGEFLDTPLTQPLTKQEAYGLAIAGTKDNPYQTSSLQTAANWAINRLFFEEQKVQDITQPVWKEIQTFNSDLLTEAGNTYVNNAVRLFANNVKKDPTRFDEYFTQLIAHVEKIYQGKVPVVRGEGGIIYEVPKVGEEVLKAGVSPKRITKKALENLESETYLFGSNKDKIYSGMYFAAESDRMIKSMINDIIASEPMLQGIKDKRTIQDAAASLLQSGGNNSDAILDLVRKETKRSIPQFDRLPVQEQERLIEEFIDNLETFQLAKLQDEVDFASMVLSKNGFDQVDAADIQQELRRLDNLLQNEELGTLYLGKETYDLLRSQIGEGRLSTITKQIDDLIKPKTAGKAIGDNTKSLFNWLNGLRYTGMLTLRPRFHGVNFLGAPEIVYRNTGSIPLEQLDRGRKVAFVASNPASKIADEIAVTTPSGKKYTYGEIYDLTYQNGTRQQLDFITAATNDAQLHKYINQRFGEGAWNDSVKRSWEFLKETPVKEDQMWRSAAMIQALEQGKTIEDAVALSRASLFDYSNLTELERDSLAKWIMFYNFQRQSFIEGLKALHDPKRASRLAAGLKAKRDFQEIANELAGEELNNPYYDPDYFKTRAKLRKIMDPNDKNRSISIASAPFTSYDTFMMAALLMDDPKGFVLDRLRPEMKYQLGLNRDTGRKVIKVTPEFVYALTMAPTTSGFAQNDPQKVFNLLSMMYGEDAVTAYKSDAMGNIDGYVYEVDVEKSSLSGKAIDYLIDVSGSSTLARDWSRIIYPNSSPMTDELDWTTRFLYYGGAVTPMKDLTPEERHRFNLQSKLWAMSDEKKKTGKEKKKVEGE